jgi:hypothetical protein
MRQMRARSNAPHRHEPARQKSACTVTKRLASRPEAARNGNQWGQRGIPPILSYARANLQLVGDVDLIGSVEAVVVGEQVIVVAGMLGIT